MRMLPSYLQESHVYLTQHCEVHEQICYLVVYTFLELERGVK